MSPALAASATPRSVLWLVGRQTTVIAASGIAIGIVAALALTRFMQTLLFEVQPTDPVTFVTIAAASSPALAYIRSGLS